MTTGQRIKAARKDAGLTQKELGQRLGVTYQTIAQWENNLRNPKYDTLKRIADALNVSVASLNGWDSAQDRLNSAGFPIDDVAYEMNIPIETLQKIISNEDTVLSEAMPKVVRVAALLASEMEKEAFAQKEREMKDYVARRSKGEAGPEAFDGSICIHALPEHHEYGELMKKYADGAITDAELRRLGELQAKQPPLKESFGLLKTTLDRMKRCLLPLNEEGQQKVIEHAETYAQDLAEIPRYRRQEPAEASPASPGGYGYPHGTGRGKGQIKAPGQRPRAGKEIAMNNEQKILQMLERLTEKAGEINQRSIRTEELLTEVDQRSIRTQVLLETDYHDRLQLLYEGHASIMHGKAGRADAKGTC